MPIVPERENPPVPETIQARPDVPEISEKIEKGVGVTTVPTQFTSQVTDDAGKGLIQPTATTFQIPTNQTTLVSQSKGPITSSLTWFAAFWLRMIKKALHMGWSVVAGRPSEVAR